METTVCVRCHVSGRVQGVWYRASTREQARALGLRGHALNLDDGRVEVLACGPPAAVRHLCDWLWKGPPGARVAGVDVEEVPVQYPDGFVTG